MKGLTAGKQIDLARQYIDPSKMNYVGAGDAASQLLSLKKVGPGKPVLRKN